MALVALDWNGTLIDDTAGWAAAYNAALGVLGIPAQPLEVLQDKYDTPTAKSIFNFGVSQSVYDANAAALYQAFKTTLVRENAQATLRAGARAFVEQTLAAGHEVYLLSNHQRDDLAAELERCGLSGLFAQVSGRDTQEQIRTLTTKADRLVEYMEARGYYPQETVIIGDAREEARIARDMGLLGIGITGGYSSRTRMLEDGAHYVVDGLHEIPPILKARL